LQNNSQSITEIQPPHNNQDKEEQKQVQEGIEELETAQQSLNAQQ